MKKNFLKIIVLLILFLIILFAFSMFLISKKEHSKKQQSQVCFRNHCFEVELAVDRDEKIKGLMFREDLNRDKGMLFVYNKEDVYPFWMKNMKFPIDIIWINKEKEVVFISPEAEPCSEEECSIIDPETKAKYVLEIKAGLSKEIGLKKGDKADIIIY